MPRKFITTSSKIKKEHEDLGTSVSRVLPANVPLSQSISIPGVSPLTYAAESSDQDFRIAQFY